MGDYESGYDAKYGYNRNAFAHKTIGTVIMGRVVKLIVTPIGLTSEAVHHHKDKKKRSESQPDVRVITGATTTPENNLRQDLVSLAEGQGDKPSPVCVKVPGNEADELIASNQAVPADGETATHELVLDDGRDDGIERDEGDWALDEAASETEVKSESDEHRDGKKEKLSVQVAIHNTQPAKPKDGSRSRKIASNKLPFPVILPQRRPGTKARGFVRAYAPLLQDSGISQDIFLSFLKEFHRAAQASPIFDVIMVATAIAGFYPDMLIGMALQAIQIAAGIGQEIQERLRTNKFLDQANKELFIPNGLFALIVTYKSGDSEQTEIGTKTIDLGASALAKYGDASVQPERTTSVEGEDKEKQGRVDEMKEKMKRLRIASGETHGEAEFPVTCAPLTFPALDAIAATTSATNNGSSEGVANSIKAKTKSTSKFVNYYFDRRAQAIYVSHTQSFKAVPWHYPNIACQLTERKGRTKSSVNSDIPDGSSSSSIPIPLCRPEQRNQHALLHADNGWAVQGRAVS